MPPVPEDGVAEFINSLYHMVGNPGSKNIIEWAKSGDEIFLLDETLFTARLLPQYFRASNLASFVRQLNLYGFSKRGNRFSHPNFHRDRPDDLHLIKRKNVPKDVKDKDGNPLPKPPAPPPKPSQPRKSGGAGSRPRNQNKPLADVVFAADLLTAPKPRPPPTKRGSGVIHDNPRAPTTRSQAYRITTNDMDDSSPDNTTDDMFGGDDDYPFHDASDDGDDDHYDNPIPLPYMSDLFEGIIPQDPNTTTTTSTTTTSTMTSYQPLLQQQQPYNTMVDSLQPIIPQQGDTHPNNMIIPPSAPATTTTITTEPLVEQPIIPQTAPGSAALVPVPAAAAPPAIPLQQLVPQDLSMLPSVFLDMANNPLSPPTATTTAVNAVPGAAITTNNIIPQVPVVIQPIIPTTALPITPQLAAAQNNKPIVSLNPMNDIIQPIPQPHSKYTPTKPQQQPIVETPSKTTTTTTTQVVQQSNMMNDILPTTVANPVIIPRTGGKNMVAFAPQPHAPTAAVISNVAQTNNNNDGDDDDENDNNNNNNNSVHTTIELSQQQQQQQRNSMINHDTSVANQPVNQHQQRDMDPKANMMTNDMISIGNNNNNNNITQPQTTTPHKNTMNDSTSPIPQTTTPTPRAHHRAVNTNNNNNNTNTNNPMTTALVAAQPDGANAYRHYVLGINNHNNTKIEMTNGHQSFNVNTKTNNYYNNNNNNNNTTARQSHDRISLGQSDDGLEDVQPHNYRPYEQQTINHQLMPRPHQPSSQQQQQRHAAYGSTAGQFYQPPGPTGFDHNSTNNINTRGGGGNNNNNNNNNNPPRNHKQSFVIPSNAGVRTIPVEQFNHVVQSLEDQIEHLTEQYELLYRSQHQILFLLSSYFGRDPAAGLGAASNSAPGGPTPNSGQTAGSGGDYDYFSRMQTPFGSTLNNNNNKANSQQQNHNQQQAYPQLPYMGGVDNLPQSAQQFQRGVGGVGSGNNMNNNNLGPTDEDFATMLNSMFDNGNLNSKPTTHNVQPRNAVHLEVLESPITPHQSNYLQQQQQQQYPALQKQPTPVVSRYNNNNNNNSTTSSGMNMTTTGTGGGSNSNNTTNNTNINNQTNSGSSNTSSPFAHAALTKGGASTDDVLLPAMTNSPHKKTPLQQHNLQQHVSPAYTHLNNLNQADNRIKPLGATLNNNNNNNNSSNNNNSPSNNNNQHLSFVEQSYQAQNPLSSAPEHQSNSAFNGGFAAAANGAYPQGQFGGLAATATTHSNGNGSNNSGLGKMAGNFGINNEITQNVIMMTGGTNNNHNNIGGFGSQPNQQNVGGNNNNNNNHNPQHNTVDNTMNDGFSQGFNTFGSLPTSKNATGVTFDTLSSGLTHSSVPNSFDQVKMGAQGVGINTTTGNNNNTNNNNNAGSSGFAAMDGMEPYKGQFGKK